MAKTRSTCGSGKGKFGEGFDSNRNKQNIRVDYCLLCQEYGHQQSPTCTANDICYHCGGKGYVRRDCQVLGQRWVSTFSNKRRKGIAPLEDGEVNEELRHARKKLKESKKDVGSSNEGDLRKQDSCPGKGSRVSAKKHNVSRQNSPRTSPISPPLVKPPASPFPNRLQLYPRALPLSPSALPSSPTHLPHSPNHIPSSPIALLQSLSTTKQSVTPGDDNCSISEGPLPQAYLFTASAAADSTEVPNVDINQFLDNIRMFGNIHDIFNKPVIKEIALQSHHPSLKERPSVVVSALYGSQGVQCSLCGLRYSRDKMAAYRSHLDWHFRINRREKDNARKAQSRRWYLEKIEWIVRDEIEDLIFLVLENC